jgi:voltage-gated potassium channel
MMKQSQKIESHPSAWRAKLYEIIFEAETPAGKTFDIVLLWAIVASIVIVLMESVPALRQEHGPLLRGIEWGLTVLFSVEYAVRCLCVKKPARYARSFFGIIDLLAIVPTYLSVFMVGARSLSVIRALRLLRVFRVLKLGRYIGEYESLLKAVKASKDKITVFLSVVIVLTVIMGTVMYLVEGEGSGFTSIPKSIYWAIVTMTTVGYGDIAPRTILGQFLASVIMILGYALIVVPTGIFSVEFSRTAERENANRQCPHCQADDHLNGAIYCCYCGKKL